MAWLLAFEADSLGKRAGRWKRIGQAVFGGAVHAPVVVYPGQTQWLLDEFRTELWVDCLANSAVLDFNDDALKWAFAGPLTKEWAKSPPHPVISFLPCENALGPQSKHRVSADDVRKAAFWSLLMSPPAGISYCGQGVQTWDTSVLADEDQSKRPALPLWHRALFLPGARQLRQVGDFFGSFEYWRLRPAPRFVASQPGASSPRRYVSSAGTEEKDLSLFYVPDDRTLDAALDSLPPSPQVQWINARTGDFSPAVGVIGEQSCQFPTPDGGDWLLIMKAGK